MALDARQPVSVRQAAVTGLCELGPDAPSAVGPLIACLADEDPVLRANAVLALSRIGAPAVEGLTACLTSEDERMRLGAIETLGWIGPDARPAFGTLKAILPQLSVETLMASYAALVKISGLAAEGVPMLVARLDHSDARIRLTCLERLAELGETAAEAAIPMLICLKDPADEVRAAAALALACIKSHSTEAVEALTQLLEDPHPPARIHAAIALSTMGASAQPALTRLQQLQADSDEGVAATATAAIQHIQKLSKKKADG
jgi:HEAT repeat protein